MKKLIIMFMMIFVCSGSYGFGHHSHHSFSHYSSSRNKHKTWYEKKSRKYGNENYGWSWLLGRRDNKKTTLSPTYKGLVLCPVCKKVYIKKTMKVCNKCRRKK